MDSRQPLTPPAKLIAPAIVLAILGYGGNMLTIPVAFGVAFIFGGIFANLAALLLGAAAGSVVALIAASHTYLLWNHPYAMVIFTLEVAWIGNAWKRGYSNLVLIDALYWLVIGAPLIILFYGGIMALGAQHATIIMLKQTLNGLFNALAATLLLHLLPASLGKSPAIAGRRVSFDQVIFQMTAAFLIIPSLGMLLLQGHREITYLLDNLVTEIRDETKKTATLVTSWAEEHINAVRVISQLAESHALRPSPQLQEELAHIHVLFPDFHNVFLGDAGATTIAFDPPANERNESTIGINFADRAWFKELSGTLRPTISDVFVGRGGIFVPIFSISVPALRDGKLSHFGLGAVNLRLIQKLLSESSHETEMLCTIIDRNGRVVASTDPHLKPMDTASSDKPGQTRDAGNGVSLFVPGTKKNISIMEAWKGASYFCSLPIAATPWTLRTEYQVGPLQQHFYATAIRGLSVVTISFAILIALAAILSRLITAPILALAKVSKDLPTRIKDKEPIDWPSSNLLEISDLIAHFQQAARGIETSFEQINRHNLALEQMIRERTADLEKQRQRLGHIIEGTNVGTWEWNIQSGETIFNERWAEMIGYSLDELQPTDISTWIDLTHPDDLERCQGRLESHFAGESDYYECECRMRHKNGQWIWVLDRGKLISRSPDGRPLAMSGTHSDITRNKQTIEALQESEARFRSLADSAPVLIWISGPDKLFTWLNQGWLDFTGNRPGQEMGNGWRGGVHPEDLAALLERYSEAFAERQPFRIEYRHRRSDGTYRWLINNGIPRRKDDGTFVGYIGTCIDVTEQKELQEQLATVMEEQRIILDNANVGISLVKNRRQEWANKKLQALFGYSLEEMIHSSTRLFFSSQESYEQFGKEAYPVLASGDAFHTEIFFRKKNGELLPISISGKAVNPERVQEGSIWIFEDITERLEAKRQLQDKTKQLTQLTRELEERVEKELALRLKSEQLLFQQSKLAAMGEMLGAISHQWRQPLNALALMVQDLGDAFAFGELDQEYLKQTTSNSMEQIQHMSKTIDDFRNFFRPDKEKGVFDSMRAVAEVARLVAAQLAANRIDFRIICHTHQRTFEPDRGCRL